jgi:uncharacterized damage-inducible protein DinB
MSDPAYFRRLFEYDAWCSQRVCDALVLARGRVEEIGVAALAAPMVRALEVYSHMQAARRLWLSRLGVADPPEDGLFPEWDFEHAVDEARLMDGMWCQYTHNLEADQIEREVTYVTTEGQRVTSRVRDIFTHVVNHSTYHRGQLASLVASCGVMPPETDYIIFARTHGTHA